MKGRLLVLIAACGVASPAEAVINPELTPVHLVRQAEQVWLLTLQATDRADRLAVRIDKTLHGPAPERALIVDLSLLDKATADAFADSARDRPAVWFVTRVGAKDAANATLSKVGLLHVAGRWHRLIGRTPLVWQLEGVDRSFDSTWNGGTQMLARAVEYILADPSTVIPATCDAAWGPTQVDVTEEQQIVMRSLLAGGAVSAASPGPSITADFDGDSFADVVQISTEGATLRRGQATGLLPPAVIEGVKPRGEPRSVAIGDFEADCKLDLLVVGTEGCSLWTNISEGTFSETFAETGELAALSGAKPAGVQACDINNDGRQDLLVWYKERAPQIFFNRGFRCFGLATTLALDKHPELGGNQGIQAAAVADFNGDGCQDLVAATADGSLVLVPRDPSKGNKMGVTVSVPSTWRTLPASAPTQAASATPTGPLTVSALDGKRSLGAQVVQPGQPAFFGKTNKGPLTLSWRLPGSEPRSKQVIVLKPTQLALEP